MMIARPELELLSSQIAGTNHMTAFADANGVILDAILDTEFEASGWASSIRPGSVWREDLRGTNALGLALHTGQTSVVTGAEHFFANHAEIACVSAPIFASDGAIVGLLDASSEVVGRQQHTRALIDLAATNIENRLFVESHRSDHVIQFHPRREYLVTQSTGLVAFDGAGRLTGANRRASHILAGQTLVQGLAFSDLFEGQFRQVLQKLQQGDVIQIKDWMRSSYFVRLRPSAPPAGRGACQTRVVQDGLSSKPQPVFDDDLVREGLRVIRAMQEVNQPVCITGEAGVGKSTIVEQIQGSNEPLYTVDCRRLLDQDGSEVTFPFATSAVLARGGTLLLDNISALNGECPAPLAYALEQVRRGPHALSWTILATAEPDVMPKLGAVRFHITKMPQLSQRTDFEKLVRLTLSEFSTQHQISVRGINAIAGLPMPENFWDLRHHLQVLVASCPKGVIRDTQIEALFGRDSDADDVCPRCRGSVIREKRCHEIRNMFRNCQHNVALTARRLGVARNTVYLHLKD